MSFSLGFDDVSPNQSSYQGSPFHGSSDQDSNYGGNYSGGMSASIGTGEEAFSSAFSNRGSSVTSPSQDLKDMLESNKDNLKLEAMKRLISMIARGKNEAAARTMFPCVVKCVVTKNPELKKLVYAYLVRFAENEPDLALLSVSSFQRSSKDPNPLIRGSALRVLASIRVPVIAPLILQAIKESINDMSPYVRKTAALSIPKLVTLEPEMKEEAVALIERLLGDRTSHVLGSVIAAFTQVCPDRLDLIHPHYRKFVSLLPDFDEWGQVILIQLLTRYARNQFTDPFKGLEGEGTPKVPEKREDGDDDEEEDEDASNQIDIDNDLRMLLKNTRPLLQSRNSAVVFSVLQLHLAIFFEPGENVKTKSKLRAQSIPEWMTPCVKPLIRMIASSHSEIQQLVLTSIVSLTSKPDLAKTFDPFLRSFFVKSRDSIHVKLLKLQILTNLSSSTNIGLILREFQAYVNTYGSCPDSAESDSSKFISCVITAIGDVATRVREVAEICLKGLIALLSNKSNEAIIAQSVIVIRTQIMNRERESNLLNSDKLANASTESTASNDSVGNSEEVTTLIIKQLINSKLMTGDPEEGWPSSLPAGQQKNKSHRNKLSAWSKARATILWILSEFCSRNLKAYQMSPDVLRQFARTFPNESNLVKLQVIQLSAKMVIASSPSFPLPFLVEGQEKDSLFDREKLVLLNDYLFNLAKYDLNYDVRDRSRFLNFLVKGFNGPNRESVQAILFRKQIKPSMTNGADHEVNDGQDIPKKKERKRDPGFRVGTLAHFLNCKTPGYEELPPFPEVQPDPSVREHKEPEHVHHNQSQPSQMSSSASSSPGSRVSSHGVPSKKMGSNETSASKKKEDKFYSDDSSDESDDESDDDGSSDGSEEDSEEESGEDETSGEEESGSEEEESEEDEEGESESEESGGGQGDKAKDVILKLQ